MSGDIDWSQIWPGTSGYEPRFDRDYAYGRQGEILVDNLLTWAANGDGRLETKRKRYLDLDFYVETEHNPFGTGWKPSGIALTQAEVIAWVIGDTRMAVFVLTVDIRRYLGRGYGRPVEETDGDCPTRGRLLNLGQLLTMLRKERLS